MSHQNNASLEQACDQFNEELQKMLDGAAPQKGKIYGQAKKNHVTSTLLNKKEFSKTGMVSTKITDEITTGEPMPPKETGTTDY